MDYPRYLKEGWQIGSGHIEAACKTVVNQRLKQSGMRWGGDGADAVCHLRALYEGENRSMGCLLGSINQLVNQPSTNRKDAHPVQRFYRIARPNTVARGHPPRGLSARYR